MIEQSSGHVQNSSTAHFNFFLREMSLYTRRMLTLMVIISYEENHNELIILKATTINFMFMVGMRSVCMLFIVCESVCM